jgi:hypothetical protein
MAYAGDASFDAHVRLESASRRALRIPADGVSTLLGETTPSIELDQGLMLARFTAAQCNVARGEPDEVEIVPERPN